MASLTKFTISPSGKLVYKSTGKLAPSTYTFRKNTVYGPNGRRIGSLSRKLTKTEAAKIAKAERHRAERARRSTAKKSPGAPSAPSKRKPSKPQKMAKAAGVQKYGDDWDEFTDDNFPGYSDNVKEEFAQRVRASAASVAPPALQKKIMNLTTDALWKAYEEDQYIFEVYFQYHQPWDAPHKSDISVWLYQFVARVEQYMDVM